MPKQLLTTNQLAQADVQPSTSNRNMECEQNVGENQGRKENSSSRRAGKAKSFADTCISTVPHEGYLLQPTTLHFLQSVLSPSTFFPSHSSQYNHNVMLVSGSQSKVPWSKSQSTVTSSRQK